MRNAPRTEVGHPTLPIVWALERVGPCPPSALHCTYPAFTAALCGVSPQSSSSSINDGPASSESSLLSPKTLSPLSYCLLFHIFIYDNNSISAFNILDICLKVKFITSMLSTFGTINVQFCIGCDPIIQQARFREPLAIEIKILGQFLAPLCGDLIVKLFRDNQSHPIQSRL